MALTDASIRAAKPKDKLYRKADSNGLCLEVAPTGSKLWRYRYRFNDKAKMMALGPYPAITLQKARQARDNARQLLIEGIDPGVERQNVKLAQSIDGLTFEALAREWFSYNTPRWAEATANKVAAYLESDLLPALGRRPVKAVTRPELVELLRKIESRGAFNVAKKTRQWLSQIFRFGLAKGAIDGNPATDLDVVAAHAPRTKHHPHVTFAELPELLATVENANINVITRYAIRLLVLTAVRPGELRNASWSEFDFDTYIWEIPAARMKARRDHVVPLPRQAVAILEQLREITGSYALLFAGRNDSNRPMSENTVNKALKTAGYEGRQTGHGFRHLLSTELNGRGYNKDWIERQLAHGDSDDMRETYNHAPYLQQRREMMQSWADSIDATNVVSIRRANA